jgi:hypothetical protein
VWLTPDSQWREAYAEWPALAKLEYVDRIMKHIAKRKPRPVKPADEDLPVSAMKYTVEDHYRGSAENIPIRDPRVFDGDLKNIFAPADESPGGQNAADFISAHRREIVARIAYWTGENPLVVRQFADFLRERAAALVLNVRGLEASTLIELTAFGTAVMMNYRHTNEIDGTEIDGE